MLLLPCLWRCRGCEKLAHAVSAAAAAAALAPAPPPPPQGMSPLLTADLLHVLRSAGHGDEIAVVDCNFPAASTATLTASEELVMLAGADVVETVDAICSVCPIDFFDESPVVFMAPSEGNPLPAAGAEAHAMGTAVIHKHAPGVSVEPLERFEFYDRAADAFAIVQAGSERRPYANFIIKKGVVGPDGNDLKPE